MRRFICLTFAAITGATLLLSLPSPVGASAITTCTGTLSPGTYHKVVVPANAVCTSNGPLTIRGGLYVEGGATFVLHLPPA